MPILLLTGSLCIDENHVLHPFFRNRFDAGPVRLGSIMHAFSYRIAVLRDGAKPALRIGVGGCLGSLEACLALFRKALLCWRGQCSVERVTSSDLRISDITKVGGLVLSLAMLGDGRVHKLWGISLVINIFVI